MDLSPLGPWLPLLEPELQKPYFAELTRRVDEARSTVTVYPPEHEVFRAFSLTPPDQFDHMLHKILIRPQWIIDGNYMRTMALRLCYADTVFYLDYDPAVCLAGILEREGTKRVDMPWETDENDDEFIEYVKTFQNRQRPKIEALLHANESTFRLIRFTTREQSEQYLVDLRKVKEKGVRSA